MRGKTTLGLGMIDNLMVVITREIGHESIRNDSVGIKRRPTAGKRMTVN